MRRQIFTPGFACLVLMANIAMADDSATSLALTTAPSQAKGLIMHQGAQFYPLRPSNLSMSARPLTRMAPPAKQPISMSKPAAIPAAVAAKPQSAQQTMAETGFQPVLKDAPGGSAMSKQQAEQILSLFSSVE